MGIFRFIGPLFFIPLPVDFLSLKPPTTVNLTKATYWASAVIFLSSLLAVASVSAQNDFENYISISDGHFMDGEDSFLPLCLNYLTDYAQNAVSGDYYIAPVFNYSSLRKEHSQTKTDFFSNHHWGFGDSGDEEQYIATAKLERDLRIIDSLGFNVVRLRPSIYWKNGILHVPTGSYETYFRLTDSLISQCTRHQLRVILVLEHDTNCFQHFDQYCVYLDSVSRHYCDNKTVMAYVVFMEPVYKWNHARKNDKLLISNWSRKWYYQIKKNAPNQLVTYGIDNISSVLFWDPSALTYDFLTMHLYHNSPDLDSTLMGLHTYFKWLDSNIDDVWMLGETGYSGKEDDQYRYADFTMQKSLDCGCQGYAWWQFQEVVWNSQLRNYFGLLTFYPEERLKSAVSLFPSFSTRTAQKRCPMPDRYYNIPGYAFPNVSGVVLDENQKPIADAVVTGWDTHYRKYLTFTNSQGEYTIKTPPNTTLRYVWISQKGYTSEKIRPSGTGIHTTILTHLNYNGWKKNWTNVEYPIASPYIVIKPSDAVIVGNFCGDEAHEMLHVTSSNHTATLYRFDTHHWEQLWTGTLDGWIIKGSDRFFAGDFDGDGYDELLCMQDSRSPWAKIYAYDSHNASSWRNIWSNDGNGHIGSWALSSKDIILPGHFNDSSRCSLLFIRKQGSSVALCQTLAAHSWSTVWSGTSSLDGHWNISNVDKYYVGDLNGDGYDELLCTQVTSGASDLIALLQYHAGWDRLWDNGGSSTNSPLYPYRNHLTIGNFDSDQADELLGVGGGATKFDLNASNQWDESWSSHPSSRLSDWTVNPDDRIFFLKTMADVPDYLFVAKRSRRNYLFNAYSLNP